MMKFVCILLISIMLVEAQQTPTVKPTTKPTVAIPQHRVTAVRQVRPQPTVFVTVVRSKAVLLPGAAPTARRRFAIKHAGEPKPKPTKKASTSTSTSTSTTSSTSATSSPKSTPKASHGVVTASNPLTLYIVVLLGYLFQ
ncbi:hypothetical protein K493DRAFT_353959 [Basidiobolus meristosporus CBS 931.73]|uniref:Uncharacterized protein n=1 Tax=Basidiobolus meristosporus CBS 931.73 TaxID=1314790 RepID=A0A1Y1Y4F2_9FUNG|nr:hypothetical protein K493DRAFT_353959 [Basidiobolus meristosporus CBS 931.73]|eukprot:ORX92863.1 hypothetical protein K493DRAFT_353959 [Basidiobolus meristosporus CBS 931.73]